MNAKAGEVKDDCPDKGDRSRDHDKDWNPADRSGPDRVDEDLRDGANVGAVREDLRKAQRHAEGAKRDDERRDARGGDKGAVDGAPEGSARQRNNKPDENDAPSALGRAIGPAGRARDAQHDLS